MKTILPIRRTAYQFTPPHHQPYTVSLRGQCNPLLPSPECSIYYPELDNTPGTIINPRSNSLKAFTLIELSIVLVIIGLLAGGILVGRDLITAAGVRAQISQIEKYQTAANTFRGKYGYLPGDIKDPDASSFGFLARGTHPGQGDGNGVIQSWYNNSGVLGFSIAGEIGMFWVDLSTARLIPQSLNNMLPTDSGLSSTNPALYFPAAALGSQNYVYVWSGDGSGNMAAESFQQNYFDVASVYTMANNSTYGSGPGMTVAQALAIDKKMDDGLPQNGKVQAQWLNGAAGAGCNSATYYYTPYSCAQSDNGVAFSGTTSSCMDNKGIAYDKKSYSIQINNGAGMNCALSFKFQ